MIFGIIIFFVLLAGIVALFVSKSLEIGGREIGALKYVRTKGDPLVFRMDIFFNRLASKFNLSVLSHNFFILFGEFLKAVFYCRRKAGQWLDSVHRFVEHRKSLRKKGNVSFFLKNISEDKNERKNQE